MKLNMMAKNKRAISKLSPQKAAITTGSEIR